MTDTCACPPGACVDDKTRAMAAELLALRARVTEAEEARDIAEGQWRLSCGEANAARDRVTELEAAQREPITCETADGYHTFAELYHYRMLYNAAAFNAWAQAGLYDVHKSWRHADGEECFGGGWFVVYAQLPSGQISNHYEADAWEFFRIPERETGVEWDGHTPQEVAARLEFLLRVEAATARREAAQRAPIDFAAEQKHLRLIAFVEDMTHRGDVPPPLREHAANLLREVGEPTRSRAKAAGFFGYIPAVTRTGRGLEPADHHRVAQDPGPVAVWSGGPPEPPGRLIGYAVAFNDGGGWQVDTVRLDGGWDDAELRHHDWLSGGGYQALVVGLREVGE